MRKIILMLSVSLDGFFEGPERRLDWHRIDDELHQHFNDELRTMGGFIHGRVTYELMAGVWPTAEADPASTGPMREFARIWLDTPKFVFSRTLERVEWNSTLLRDVVPEEIRALKERPGGDLTVGGPDLAADFLRHGLVDEFRVYVHPVLIGRGRLPFPSSDAMVALRLTESRAFGNGVVLLRYERAG
ncbi:dihydrofolate reductase family protein [Streptomyces sp. YS-3]|uniref:dihydrofolate reductase family protein n=1 Tax=Streptomyces sp. YS-3 TaxID=3381352 RepID=UPI0038626862